MTATWTGCIGAAVLVFLSCHALGEQRTTLNGMWDFEPQQEYKTPAKFTAKIIVPSFWNHPESFNYPEAWRTLPAGWFRRTIDIPKAWQGQRIALRFDGIYMTGQIFFNGRQVANTWDAINPTVVDVTQLVKWGAANELMVGVREAFAQSDELFKQFDQNKVGQNFVPGGTRDAKALALVPYGFNANTEYRQNGLPRDVWLIRSEIVHVENVFIQTSTRKKEITLDYEIRNASDKPQKVTVSANVTPWKNEQVVLTLPGETIELAAGETKKVQLKKSWPDAAYWDPDHPNLYMLHTSIRETGGAFTDVSHERFGFRESWAEGRNIYLNGNVLHIRGDSLMTHGSTQFYEDDAFRALCRVYRKFNINGFRFHCHCHSLRMLEIMDEEGIMAIAESGLHGSCGDQAIEDERFWKNGQEHLRRMVRFERNFPCIVAYSVENEMGAFVQQKKPVRWDHLSALTRVVKENDPTRIAWHDGFAYGFMTANKESVVEDDVKVLHYTGPEYWAVYYNFPEANFWAKEMLATKDAFGGLPLALGEYAMVAGTTLWETNGTCHTPTHECPLLGTRTTRWPDGSLKWYWDLHWEMIAYSIRGNRYSGLAAINPFTIVQHYLQQSGGGYRNIHVPGRKFDWATPGIKFPVLHKNRAPLLDLYCNNSREPYELLDMIRPVIQANDPLLSFPRHLGSHFWGGAKISKEFFTFNDLYRPSKLTLTVTLLDEAGKTLDEFVSPLDIPVGGQQVVPVTLKTPAVTKGMAATIRVRHASDSGRQYEESYPVKIYPAIDVPKAYLFDPAGHSQKKFAAAEVAVESVASLDKLPAGAAQLIVGEECAAKLAKADLEAITKFAQNGGTVIVLTQSDKAAQTTAFGAYAPLEGRVPTWAYDLRPGPIPTTIAHPWSEPDPLMAGLTSDDLRYWANKDSAVAVYGLMMSKEKNVKPLVICNRPKQDDMRTLLARVTLGKGQIYLCQLLLTDNLSQEPVARLLLTRMLASRPPVPAAPATAPASGPAK